MALPVLSLFLCHQKMRERVPVVCRRLVLDRHFSELHSKTNTVFLITFSTNDNAYFCVVVKVRCLCLRYITSCTEQYAQLESLKAIYLTLDLASGNKRHAKNKLNSTQPNQFDSFPLRK